MFRVWKHIITCYDISHHPPSPQGASLVKSARHVVDDAYNMGMNIELTIKEYLDQERQRLEGRDDNSSNNLHRSEKGIISSWVSFAVEKASQTASAIQLLIDEKEVAMNQTNDVAELQQLAREWSALERLRQDLLEKHRRPDAWQITIAK